MSDYDPLKQFMDPEPIKRPEIDITKEFLELGVYEDFEDDHFLEHLRNSSIELSKYTVIDAMDQLAAKGPYPSVVTALKEIAERACFLLVGVNSFCKDGPTFDRAPRGKPKGTKDEPYPEWRYVDVDHHSLKTERWRYIRYSSGEEELYDTKHDPRELSNLAYGQPEGLLVVETLKMLSLQLDGFLESESIETAQ